MNEAAPARTVVLIVEDEPLLRMIAVEMVEAAGFVALEAARADDAIRILEQRSDIRIVFTDIDMPGSMDGLKLAAAIRGRWPPVELIVTSGQTIVQQAALPERGVFLPKPYREHEVVELLHRLAA